MKNKITIDSISKKTPFKVPENYFDTLQAKIEAKVGALENKQLKEVAKPTPIVKWRTWVISIAASIALLIGIYFTTMKTSAPNNEAQLTCISNTQMAQYLQNESIDIADITQNLDLDGEEIETILEENTDLIPTTLNQKELDQLEAKYFN
jgi:hypothetical protein